MGLDEQEAVIFSLIIGAVVTVLYTLVTSQLSGWNLVVCLSSILAPYILFRFDELGNIPRVGGVAATIFLLFILANPMSYAFAPYYIAKTGDVEVNVKLESLTVKAGVVAGGSFSSGTKTWTINSLDSGWKDPDEQHKHHADIRVYVDSKKSSGQSAGPYEAGDYKGDQYEFTIYVTLQCKGSVWYAKNDETGGYYGSGTVKAKISLDNHRSTRKTMVLSDGTSIGESGEAKLMQLNKGKFKNLEMNAADKNDLDFGAELYISKAGVPSAGEDNKVNWADPGPKQTGTYSASWVIKLSCASVKKVAEEPPETNGPEPPYEPEDGYTPDEPGYEDGYEPPVTIPETPKTNLTWVYLLIGGGVFFLFVVLPVLLVGGLVVLILIKKFVLK